MEDSEDEILGSFPKISMLPSPKYGHQENRESLLDDPHGCASPIVVFEREQILRGPRRANACGEGRGITERARWIMASAQTKAPVWRGGRVRVKAGDAAC